MTREDYYELLDRVGTLYLDAITMKGKLERVRDAIRRFGTTAGFGSHDGQRDPDMAANNDWGLAGCTNGSPDTPQEAAQIQGGEGQCSQSGTLNQ